MNKLIRHLKAIADPRWTELQILACSPIAGMCDAASFTAASCFVCMFTGNTVFLALGAAYMPKDDPNLWLRSLVSMTAFWVGCFSFAQLRRIGGTRKGVLALSMFIQSVLIFVSAAISQAHKVPGFDQRSLGAPEIYDEINSRRTPDQKILVPLAFLGFQAGGQIVMSRTLKINEVPINVLTSLYCDFLSDPALFTLTTSNIKRNRRLTVILGYFGGAVGSGWLQRSSGGIPAVLWLAAGLKLLMSLLWLVWPEETPGQSKEDKV